MVLDPIGRKLRLRKRWQLGERIGGGGFGEVFVATSSDEEAAVAKLVPKAPGAQSARLVTGRHRPTRAS